MCLSERASAFPHGGRYRNLENINQLWETSTCSHTYRIVCVFREDVGQQIWHPAFDGIRVALDQSADPKNCRMELTDSSAVRGRLPVCRELAILDQPNKSILCETLSVRRKRIRVTTDSQRNDASARGKTQDTRKSPRKLW